MREAVYDGTLGGLFALLDRLWALPEECRPRQIGRRPVPQADLFDEGADSAAGEGAVSRGSSPPELLPDPAVLDGAAGILYRVSADAYDALVYAWMSGLSVEGVALRYALRVLTAAKKAVPAAVPWYGREEARHGAAVAARNRLDDDCRTVLALAYKVAHEIDRFRGFLRFNPDARGRYTALCAPDYGILPGLAPHFSRRFGDTPWAVIDEKRGLALVREGREPRILVTGEAPLGENSRRGSPSPGPRVQDPWEKLWQSYHRTISIGGRENPALQRRFIPLRYRDYLNEFDDPPEDRIFTPPFPGNCN
ncbi:MAG: TIGR03915 family putative DNA repair protein [Treponema sp.]|jgi:probable DNA metabolism protein|nr:TIGR03915 family putative DNA repair protein [Treponema sp.]